MKIAIVSLQFEETATGGGGVHVKHISDEFLKLGHEVTIISIHTEKTLPQVDIDDAEGSLSVQRRGGLTIARFLIDKGIEQPYVGTKDEELDRIKRFSDTAVKWIKENQSMFDVVSLQGHHLLPGYMAKELSGIKPEVISYLHALETTYVTEKGDFVGAYDGTREVLKRIRSWEAMARFADYVIGNSPIVNEEFRQIIAGDGDDPVKYEDRIKLIVSGCNSDFLMENEEVKKKLGAVPEVVNLITFCRIDPSKGVEYSIRGARVAAKLSDQKFCLTIAGIPSSDEYIDKLYAESGDIPANLEIKFKFMTAISPTEEKKEILDDKHIYILPTLKEPFGMSVIEASARGDMVVSADTNGPKFIFDSASGVDTGWGIITGRGVLAKITDDHEKNFAENVGKAIAWTVDNWQRSTEHVLAFNKKILDTWTWEGIAHQYIELFNKQHG